ncbi:hypothetical protein JCM15754A_19210 [Prevotella aurantiaca JCM 15754]|uniref:hypothetical protein n=1 Tax=Prevotella aurantiaca TaxID=596085 RepID=UPI0023531858|nr:hypothetical protein [Prevotella aurantiaca]
MNSNDIQNEEVKVTSKNEKTKVASKTPQQTIIIQQAETKPSNSIGTAGFVLALIGLVFCWVPVANVILWLLGLIFSFVGVFKKPKGLSIAGLCISSIVIIIIVSLVGLLIATS